MRTRVQLRFFLCVLMLGAFLLAHGAVVRARAAADVGDYEGRPIEAVEVVIEGSPEDPSAQAEFASLINVGTEYSAVRVRDALQALFDSGRVDNARVEVFERPGAAQGGAGPIRLRFVVHRQVLVGDVALDILNVPPGTAVSEDEIRARLNMLEPGARFTEQNLRRNADLIQEYLRDRGFFRAEVDFTPQLDTGGTRARVTYRIRLNEQARVAAFNISIAGFDAAQVRPTLKLQPGAPFSRQSLGEDLGRIRQAIIALGYLAPQLNDPQVSLDSASNLVTVNLTGGIGPKVEVRLVDYELKEKKARELLPVKREGNIDASAIEEGARRLRNSLQEEGYFFAEVTAACTVTPPLPEMSDNGTPEACLTLNPEQLTGHTVQISYQVERGRRFKLTDIRIEGTDKLSFSDVEDDLRSQEANALGFIPFLGYGRGYTSRELLEQDRRRIRDRMRDLGYRRADVTVRQGVSINGENLIITFVVDQKELTRIADVEIRGNQIYTASRLQQELETAGRERCEALATNTTGPAPHCYKTVPGAPFSRTQARADGDRLLNLYARGGYVDARLDFSLVELPKVKLADGTTEEQVRLVYTIRQEGDKVFINRIIVNGNVLTEREAIVNAIPLKEGDVLRADKISESERILYATDAFRQVIITTESAGENTSGYKRRDVIIDVEELKPRARTIGGGYSTDNGPLGFFDIRNVNFFGKLQQGAIRLRASRRQQTLRLEYYNPYWQRYGEKQFAPLALSLQYTRDSTVTRFFRSTIDRGNFGIVQRLNEEGNPIDVNCPLAEAQCETEREPTINRFTFNAETNRVLDQKTRTAIFLRYSYEDVRLFNINSLLIADILRPDRAIRLSRFGATFVRDTRDSQFDATRGQFINVDYSLALRQLGGNLSFNKLLARYSRYHRFDFLRRAVLAGNLQLGLASLFNPRDRNDNGLIDDVDLTLPISERFFSGGSSTLRGFGYEEAGPRVVAPQCFLPDPNNLNAPISPACGLLRNQKGELVRINPFLVPIGGNAMAVTNLELRVPLTKLLQVVPFYDGGNVFRNISELFGKESNSQNPGLSEIERVNLRSRWTHTVGLGLRIKTPIGGSLAVDYGLLLNPPEFLVPQRLDGPATIRPKSSQLHFRFTQAF
ncbi:MAG TPA: POTRA domain-containing protein [Pyrinomonadaceae bacterium]|jgi:outer membrane protein insertion porin family